MKFKLSFIVAGACAAGFVASAMLNVIQYQRAQSDKKLLQGTITDLRYQMNIDKQMADLDSPTPTPSVSPSASVTPGPSTSPAVAGAVSVVLGAPVNVTLTASSPVADLTHWMAVSGAYRVASLTTNSLKAKYPACGAGDTNNALGQIVRKKNPSTSTGIAVKTFGDETIYYLAPKENVYCATDDTGKAELDADRAAIKNTVLATLAQ